MRHVVAITGVWLIGIFAAGEGGAADVAPQTQTAAQDPAVESTVKAPPVEAEPAPSNYGAALVGTTLAYRPHGGSFDGPQHDFAPSLGLGRFVTGKVALELDLGPTYVEGGYTAFSLVPGVIWAFHPHIYAAARFVVPIDPQLNLVLSPGVGALYAFKNGLQPFCEINVQSNVGRGKPDLGVALTVGVLKSF
jgi:hypothetical protein